MKSVAFILLVSLCFQEYPETQASQLFPSEDSSNKDFQLSLIDSADQAWRDSLSSWLNAIAKLRTSIITVVSKAANLAEADSIFGHHRDIYLKQLYSSSLWDQARFQAWVFSNDTYVATIVKRDGLILQSTEGTYYVDGNPPFPKAQFEKFLSPAMMQFLSIEASQRMYSEDGILLISWDKVSERIIQWEEFAKKNPRFVLIEEVRAWLRDYTKTYLFGLGNSPTFLDHSDSISTHVLDSYKRLLRKNPRSNLAKLIRRYLVALEEDGFRYGPTVEDFLVQNKIIFLNKRQPSTR